MTDTDVHYQIDIESLATSRDAIIVSVGICKFSLESGVISDHKYWELNLRQQEKMGRKLSTDCIRWWSGQSKEALAAINNNNRVPLETFVKEFNDFIKDPGFYWSKGTNFDLELITNLYEQLGQYAPFKYSKWADARVMYLLGNRLQITPKDIERTGAHNALDDALYQTKVVCEVYRQIKQGIISNRKGKKHA